MIKNAIAYVTRKRNRTLIVFVILALVLSCLYSCLSVMKSSNKLEETLYRSSNSSLSLTKNGDGYFELDQVRDLKKIGEIEELLPLYDGLAKPANIGLVEGRQQVERYDIPDEFKNLLALEATSNTSRNILFTSGVFQLQRGRHIGINDRGKILIHEDLAKKNSLKVNDIIGLELIEASKERSDLKYNFRIAGIFSGKKQEKYTGLSSDFSENMVFVDYESSQRALGRDPSRGLVNKLGIFPSGPQSRDLVEKKVRDLKLDWTKYRLDKDTSAFEESLEALAGIRHIIRLMTISIMIGGIMVLSLILVLWIRERIYEIGILLSIGMTKASIVGQFILEILLITIPAMLVALLFGNILVGQILGGLLDADSPANLASNLLSTASGLGVMTSFLQACGLLVGIILVSVLFASMMILIRKPKDILSKIS